VRTEGYYYIIGWTQVSIWVYDLLKLWRGGVTIIKRNYIRRVICKSGNVDAPGGPPAVRANSYNYINIYVYRYIYTDLYRWLWGGGVYYYIKNIYIRHVTCESGNQDTPGSSPAVRAGKYNYIIGLTQVSIWVYDLLKLWRGGVTIIKRNYIRRVICESGNEDAPGGPPAVRAKSYKYINIYGYRYIYTDLYRWLWGGGDNYYNKLSYT